MPRLDSAIERLFKEAATALTMETGSGMSLRRSDGVVPVIKQALTTKQIIGALSELVPNDLKNDFPQDGETRFSYVAPAGAVSVHLDFANGKIRATVTPDRDSDSDDRNAELELASAADMLPMAQAQANGGFNPFDSGSNSSAKVNESGTYKNGKTLVMQNFTPPTPNRSRPNTPVSTPVPASSATASGATAAAAAAVTPIASKKAASVPSSVARRQMDELLSLMLEQRASDLHLSSDTVPMLRVDGDITPQPDLGDLSDELLRSMIWSIAPEKNIKEWEAKGDTDFAHETDAARFRVNVFTDRKGIGSVLRQIPNSILSAEQMGLSKAILDLCFLTKGLVLVTGPTGSGKSTTLAALIDFINRNREDHIITIEDPIEFVHPNKKCLVNQREVGVHTQTFKAALRAALREDPDVILVGELRDLETISIAIETAETGHLVFGTLHTNTAPSTVDRIIDQFPPDRQSQVRTMMSESLKGVISQTLCKKVGGGRVPVQEVLLVSSSVANVIREGKTFQIPSLMQTARGAGMVMLNDALFELVKKRVVDPKEAYMKSVMKSEFKGMLDKAGIRVELPRGADT
jgi:twitching motility protein PilT